MSEPPRILLIGGLGGLSGVPRHLRHVVSALDGRAAVTVAHDQNHGGYDFLDTSGAASITVRGLATRPNLVHLWRAWRWIQRARQSGEYDLVWAHARMPVLMLRLGPRHSRTPLMLSYHGLPFDPGHRIWARQIGTWIEALLLHCAPPMTLVVLSDTAAQALRRALPGAVKRHRIVVLPNTSDLAPAAPEPRPAAPQVVMTGRVSWQKNLEAAARLIDTWPEAELTLCGHGTDSPNFAGRLARSVGPDTLARITRLGPVPDVRPYLAGADLYLLTSRYEGVPIGALEAFEAGLPLALPAGHHDLLDHHPLSSEIDPAAPLEAARVAQALVRRFRQDPEGWSERIRAAWSRHYAFHTWSERLNDCVTTALGPRSGQQRS